MPPLPPDVTWRYPALAQFAANAESRVTRDDATTPVPDQVVLADTSTPPASTPRYAGRAPGDSSRPRRSVLTWRLGDALRDADRQQLLEALVRREAAPVACRRFQNSQHRLDTRRYNAALKSLIAAGFVERVKRDRVSCLVLSAEVRHLIGEAQTGVRRAPSARAMRRAESGTSSRRAERDGRQTRARASARKRTYRPRRIPDRRHYPHQWGKSMRARLGGLSVQKLYRKFGKHPTAPATAARQAKRAQRERQVAARVVTYAAPPACSPVQRAPDDARPPGSPSSTTVALSAAYRTLAPIGRDARLRDGRNRR